MTYLEVARSRWKLQLARVMTGLASAALLVFMTACNHLFYFPDRGDHWHPDKLGIDYEQHTVVTADGIKLKLWLLHPQGTPRRAVIVQLHGNGENMSTHFMFVAWLAAAGYDVVTFDYRGYGGSTGVPERAGLITDATTVLDWVAHKDSLRGEPVIVLGQSLGGAVAIPAVARAPAGRVQALIIESSFGSYRGIARSKLADIWLTWPFQYPLSYLVTDEDSPLASVGSLPGPLLFIHGDADPVVPIASGRELFAAAGAKDKEFWTVPGGGHLPAFGDPHSPWRPRLLAYLCAHHLGRCSG